MAQFSKGYSWTNEEINPTKLHDTVDKANLTAIAAADLASGLYFVSPTPDGTTVGRPFYEDERIKCKELESLGPYEIDPGAVTYSFVNSGALTLIKGDIVRWDSTATDVLKIVKSTSSLPAVGVVEDDFINPSSAGRVRFKGLTYIQCENSTGSAAGFQDFVVPGSTAGVGDVFDQTSHTSDKKLARLMTSIPAGSGAITVEVRVF